MGSTESFPMNAPDHRRPVFTNYVVQQHQVQHMMGIYHKRIFEHFSNYWNVTCVYDRYNSGGGGMEGSMVGDLLFEILLTQG